MHMKETAFEMFRADRERVLGVSMESLAKIFKLCDNNDAVTLKSEDDSDTVQFVFENADEDKISDFSLKLLDIEAEHLGIPENDDWKCLIKLPSGELQKICRDLKEFGDSINISATKDGLKFTVAGDIGTGNVMVKPKDADKDAARSRSTATSPSPPPSPFATSTSSRRRRRSRTRCRSSSSRTCRSPSSTSSARRTAATSASSSRRRSTSRLSSWDSGALPSCGLCCPAAPFLHAAECAFERAVSAAPAYAAHAGARARNAGRAQGPVRIP